jgi:hypothetical protein
MTAVTGEKPSRRCGDEPDVPSSARADGADGIWADHRPLMRAKLDDERGADDDID